VSVTLSAPVRVAAIVGALVLTGLAAFVLLVGRGALSGDGSTNASSTPLIQPPAHAPATSAKAGSGGAAAPKPAPAHKPAPTPASGLPPRIDHALRYRRVVVVSISIPGAAVDSVMRREARAAAATSRAGFVPLSALNERAMAALVAKAGVLPDPAVLVVRRPGRIVATFSVTDAGTIAQAVAQAR
jgi:hypothetical protein